MGIMQIDRLVVPAWVGWQSDRQMSCERHCEASSIERMTADNLPTSLKLVMGKEQLWTMESHKGSSGHYFRLDHTLEDGGGGV